MKTSKIESLTRNVVNFYYPNIEIIYNHRPDWLKNVETGRNLELDIFIPEKNIAIEVNGITHKLEKNIVRGEFKNARCEERGIRLIIVEHKGDLFNLGRTLGFNEKLPKSIFKRISRYSISKKFVSKLSKVVERQLKWERDYKIQRQEIANNKTRLDKKEGGFKIDYERFAKMYGITTEEAKLLHG
jgi:hypothetical protein